MLSAIGHCKSSTVSGTAAWQAPSLRAAPSKQVVMQGEVEEVEHKLTEAENSRGQLRRFCTKFCTPVFLEAFVLTFLAGERLHGCRQAHACVLFASSGK